MCYFLFQNSRFNLLSATLWSDTSFPRIRYASHGGTRLSIPRAYKVHSSRVYFASISKLAVHCFSRHPMGDNGRGSSSKHVATKVSKTKPWRNTRISDSLKILQTLKSSVREIFHRSIIRKISLAIWLLQKVLTWAKTSSKRFVFKICLQNILSLTNVCDLPR